MTLARPVHKRILLKLSGEAFAGDATTGIDGAVVRQIAEDIVALRRAFSVDVAVVVVMDPEGAALGRVLARDLKACERRVVGILIRGANALEQREWAGGLVGAIRRLLELLPPLAERLLVLVRLGARGVDGLPELLGLRGDLLDALHGTGRVERDFYLDFPVRRHSVTSCSVLKYV